MSDPDFLAMGSDAVNNAINELQSLARNTINFIGASSEIDLTEFVDEYFAELTVASTSALEEVAAIEDPAAEYVETAPEPGGGGPVNPEKWKNK